jgi:hypothetical protein
MQKFPKKIKTQKQIAVNIARLGGTNVLNKYFKLGYVFHTEISNGNVILVKVG